MDLEGNSDMAILHSEVWNVVQACKLGVVSLSEANEMIDNIKRRAIEEAGTNNLLIRRINSLVRVVKFRLPSTLKD